MNKEERADWERRCMRFQETLEGKTPQPSPEKRLDWLEADSAAQRTAILKLERAIRLICKSLWALLAVNMLLALAVLT